MRLDFLCATLLCLGGGLLLALAPFHTSSYFIDWISGAFFGAMAGFSECYLTVSRFDQRRRGAMLSLPCRWGVPLDAGSALALLATAGACLIVLVAWPGPVDELDKIPLYLFNTLYGAWWTLWVVYLGGLLVWAVVQGRRAGQPLRAQCHACRPPS